jgi:hypothetical protein
MGEGIEKGGCPNDQSGNYGQLSNQPGNNTHPKALFIEQLQRQSVFSGISWCYRKTHFANRFWFRYS